MHFGVGRVFVAAAHGKFVAIELAQSDHACASILPALVEVATAELGYHGGIKRAAVVAQHFAGSGGGPVAGNKYIFVRNRHACERCGLPCGNAGISRAGLRERGSFVNCQKCAQIGMGLATRQKVLRQLYSAGLAGLQHLAQLGCGFVV